MIELIAGIVVIFLIVHRRIKVAVVISRILGFLFTLRDVVTIYKGLCRQTNKETRIANSYSKNKFFYWHFWINKYSKNLESSKETPATIPHAFKPKTEKNRKIIDELIKQGRTVLTEEESKRLLANYNIPILKNAVAKNEKEVSYLAGKIGFPLVMKILSPDIIHKTDVGGVELGISSKKEAKDAFVRIIKTGWESNFRK